MNKSKGFLALIICYLIWGMQPVYWSFLPGFDSMFILSIRIIMSVFFTCLYLVCTGHFKDYLRTFRDWSVMKYLAPASVFIGADWGVFIWAATHGHVLDTSIGYYLNPMIIFLVGVLLFKERGHILEYAAIILACVGVAVSTIEYGSFPVISIVCAVLWPVYATIKKAAKSDSIVSIAIESTLLCPFAIAYALIFCRGDGGFASVTWGSVPLLIGSGIVTALPMVLYTFTVNDLPFKVVGVLQYACCTISFLCGVIFLHEAITPSKLIMFGFIWAGLILFTVGSFRRHALEARSEQ